MAHYEIIYEDGSHSIAGYESDEVAVEAINAHHERALAGGRSLEGVATSAPAVRVVKVLKYDQHPADLYEDQTLPVGELEAVFAAATEGVETVNVQEVAAALRQATDPMQDSDPHESNYQAEEDSELEGPWQ